MTIQRLGKLFKSYFGFNPPIDMLSTMYHGPNCAIIDIVKLDEEFNKRDPDYDSDKCTYKGQTDISPAMYIKLKYGEDAYNLVKENI
jgi:hypothetical protein